MFIKCVFGIKKNSGIILVCVGQFSIVVSFSKIDWTTTSTNCHSVCSLSVDHVCGPSCLLEDDPVKYKGTNPLLIPLLCGWERSFIHLLVELYTWIIKVLRVVKHIFWILNELTRVNYASVATNSFDINWNNIRVICSLNHINGNTIHSLFNTTVKKIIKRR